jgi:Tfp pilus assembly protein PilO
MKKNIIITVLAALVVVLGLLAFAQKVKADQNEEEAIRQNLLKDEARADSVRIQALAEAQKQIADIEHERANSLQQQLDNCK